MKAVLIYFMLFFTLSVYSADFRLSSVVNLSLDKSDDYIGNFLYDLTEKYLESIDFSSNNSGKVNSFSIEISYISDSERIALFIDLLDESNNLVNTSHSYLSLEGNLLSMVISLLNEVIYYDYDAVKSDYRLSSAVVNNQSKKIRGYSSEFFLLFSSGAVYSGMGFISENEEGRDDLFISSPNNKWRDNFSVYVNLNFLYKSNLIFHGGFADILIPSFYDYKRLFKYSRIRTGYSLFFMEAVFLNFGLEHMLFKYSKYSGDSFKSMEVSLNTFGLSFDFNLFLFDSAFLFSSGLTLYPPFFISESPVFNILAADKSNVKNFIIPVSPRIGFSLFNKRKDLGFFFNYNLTVFNTEYDDFYYYGSDKSFLNEFRIGIIYKRNII